VVKALPIGAQGSKHNAGMGFFNTISAHPAVNGYLTFLRAGEGEGGEGWRPTSVTQLPVLVGHLAATFPHGYYGLWNNFYFCYRPYMRAVFFSLDSVEDDYSALLALCLLYAICHNNG